MDNTQNNKKEVSDMKFSDIMASEASGIGKFDHNKGKIEEALCLDSTAKERIIDVLHNAGMANCSKYVEVILTSDKLHTTTERILAGFMAGAKAEQIKSLNLISKLMRMMDDK